MNFLYICKKDNEIVRGCVCANSMAEASSQLERQGLVVLELKQQRTYDPNVRLIYTLTPLTIKEKKDFYNSFCNQYRAGISFSEILNNIINTASTNNIKSLCFSIVKKFNKTNSFEEAFASHSKYIGKVETGLLIAGEKSGKLQKVLEKIVQQIKEQEEMKNSLISKATYPMIIFGILVFSVLVFVFFVFPVFNATIEGKTIDLIPMATKAIISIIITMCVVVFVSYIVITNRAFGAKAKFLFFKLNIIQDVLEKYYFSNFFTTFSLAQEAGVDVVGSLELSNYTINSRKINERVNKAISMVKEGCEITTALGVADVFSEYAISQINVGEKTGELPRALDDISEDYKRQCMAKIDSLMKFIEPAMLGIAGVCALIIAVKMITKYYETLFSLF